MGIENMDKLFKPQAIAVIGASNREGSVGYAIYRNLIQSGYKGSLYPVNARHRTIWNETAYESVADIHKPVDLAVIATPIASIPQIMKECGHAGVGGAVIISAGGKETGLAGAELEARIKLEAKAAGIRVIGPNCLGIYSAESLVNANFASHRPIPGNMAFISQSGAICTSVLDLGAKERMGFRYFVSLGSMLDVEFGDVIDYVGADPEVSSIVMYIENLSRFRNFMSAARAVSRVKPIIALKAGRTRAGAKAAFSHTGAMTGEDAVYDAAFKRAGVIRVSTFEELFDCAELLSKHPKISSQGLAVITNAGGSGVMAVDALSDYGVEPVSLSAETIDELNKVLPPHWSHGNPVDILGDATPHRYKSAMEICLGAPEVKGILILNSPVAMTRPSEIAEALIGLLHGKNFPVFTAFIGGLDVEIARDLFNQAGIPTFDSAERAVRAYMDLNRYSRNVELLREVPPALNMKLDYHKNQAEKMIRESLAKDPCVLTEGESKTLLSLYGIPVNPVELASTVDEALSKADVVGFPLVMKINSKDISHKSDVGGVILGIKDNEALKTSFDRMMTQVKEARPDAQITGVTLQPMLKKSSYELVIGAKKDKDFGPVILFGMGGVMTEIMADRALALPPLNRLLARRLMEETRVFKALNGFRGQKPVNLEQLEEIMIRLSHLVSDFSEIEELDINPLFVDEKGALAVDARIMLKVQTVKAPLHLVISPYPNQYEDRTLIKTGETLFIRPIRPEDAPLLVTFFENLSPRTIYYRFFSPLKHLPPVMLARFTQIDYDRSMALTAFLEPLGYEKMIGVARIIGDADPRIVEFAVMIDDRWQGKGIGAELMKRLIAIARSRGVEKIWGTVLAENTQMLALGKKMGFEIKTAADAGCYELRASLKDINI
ncbi:MAG: bifunctional acetate--CoA ligase family protein/GNAT family N-acetyltransferase [Proteobacteria bacterium]|nr:bifunctional acetate--CoA ligase family protein/GNAT family N-acetyltransferase [Pseudomonadota bacterium]